jgi:hypothetical protein
MNKVTAFFILLILFLAISIIPVRKGYIQYKHTNTQYEKLVWIDGQFEKGVLKNKKFDFVVFGSSSALYGFNDSLKGVKSINLGVNTGCRAMELYLIERFYNSGNSSKIFIKEYHVLNERHFDYYGIHPMLHYFVSPIWMLNRGQDVFQPHFFIFFFKRVKVVFQSWFFFHLNIKSKNNYIGFGYRKKTSPISQLDFQDAIRSDAKVNLSPGSKISAWYHNYSIQKLLRENVDELIYAESGKKPKYIYFPVLNRLTTKYWRKVELTEQIEQLSSKENVKLETLNLKSSFFSNKSNWSDPGHYTYSGSAIFSEELLGYYQNIK